MSVGLLLSRTSPKSAGRLLIPVTKRHASTLPATVNATAEEVSRGQLTSRSLEAAVRSLHEDGLVVVSNVIPHQALDHLNAKMIADARTLQSRGDSMPYNYNKGNIQQDPPPIKAFFHESVFLNPIATQITSAVLGPKPKMTFCSGNTALPPTPGSEPQRQPVHADADFAHLTHPFGLVVNVPLITFTPQNGSTEVWLGTHTGTLAGLHVQEGAHGERASGRIKSDLLGERRRMRGPSQPVIPKGSIVVRDLRLWHAGMPNLTQDVRVMLAMIHFAPWYRNQMKLELAKDIKPLIDEVAQLEVPVDWVDAEEKAQDWYLSRAFGNAYNFDQTQ